jgi:hypothetical protein
VTWVCDVLSGMMAITGVVLSVGNVFGWNAWFVGRPTWVRFALVVIGAVLVWAGPILAEVSGA